MNRPILPPMLKASIYLTMVVLAASGIVIKLDQTLWVLHTAFGDQPNPGLAHALALHGAATQIFLILAGCMLIRHILPRWSYQHNRLSGLILLALLSTLIVSGWALYYLSNEQLHNISASLHFWAGCILGISFLLHIPLKQKIHNRNKT